MNPLVPVVRPLTPTAKQALYAATNTGDLQRRTWDRCAFNAAGRFVGTSIRSRRRAAAAFGITRGQVGRFIAAWDALPGSNDECTTLLRDAIQEVGLFTEPPPTRRRALLTSTKGLVGLAHEESLPSPPRHWTGPYGELERRERAHAGNHQ